MKALIIIDMINGFCRKGFPLSLKQDTTDIEGYIIKQIKKYTNQNYPIFFCCDSHTNDAYEFKQYPKHCLKGTYEAEIIDTLLEYSNKKNIITKNTLSIFYKTKLETILKKLDIKEIEVVGVCTDICDLFAVFELRNRGYNVFVSEFGVLPLDTDKQTVSLNYLKDKLGAKIEYKNEK